jgi:phosphoribosylaminoimidazolecarboxamide formyltransferase/IMP cyclohydrolase
MRALLSVADRAGITDLARDLLDQGVEVFATDGTREWLASDGVEVESISTLTAAPPVIGGQVKTFHPEIYAGILARRNVPSDLQSLVEHGIGLIDVVVVNVAPFAPQVGNGVVPIDEALAMIDIGGVALLSAAARNYAAVVVASHHGHYPLLIEELRARGHVSPETRLRLAAQAFAAVAAYDAEVAAYLHHISGVRFPEELTVVLRKQRDLAYGANPQQRAALYLDASPRPGSIADARRLQGPEPTFNDLLDLDTAWRIVCDFTGATCCIAKQLNPVGLASNDSLLGAYRGALETDRVAAYGAIVAVNRVVDAVTADEIVLSVYEALAAPGFSDEALEVLATRPALTLLEVAPMPATERSEGGIPDLDLHRIDGGVLVQTQDRALLDHSQLNVVTKRRPTLEELTDLLFAWRAVRHVTSNAVVLARHGALVGVGAGQASRLTAVEIALHRASDRAAMSALASDAYFPFADAIALAGERGVTAIIQPGGSVRDEMAIEVADRHHMAMVFTGRRHFRH